MYNPHTHFAHHYYKTFLVLTLLIWRNTWTHSATSATTKAHITLRICTTKKWTEPEIPNVTITHYNYTQEWFFILIYQLVETITLYEQILPTCYNEFTYRQLTASLRSFCRYATRPSTCQQTHCVHIQHAHLWHARYTNFSLQDCDTDTIKMHQTIYMHM